jgi:hypothetical protein
MLSSLVYSVGNCVIIGLLPLSCQKMSPNGIIPRGTIRLFRISA